MSKSHTGALTSQARLKTLTFGAEETTRLLDVSSSSKTSLTGIIQAALVASLFANLPSEITILHAEGRMSPQEFQSFGGTIAESNNMPGFAHREIHTRQEITTASVWCEAQHIHSGTKAELARKKSKVKMDSARGRKSHNKADIRDSAGEAEDINLLVSNMGDFRDHKQSDSQEQLCW
ncbi:hypothetical protein N7508_010732 [Penicillium antarcticum]|uniref:uncharacterized protein n=1 Tax=Penicillium antarcticum TaxID=416450 RepID=UPI0023967AB0|nr:uncharacterized protein N7508_010732 [Penicillium antarcticum]KAJ5295911.1 hypothetical protein N7508_010732 [Penicillium antarcticum]